MGSLPEVVLVLVQYTFDYRLVSSRNLPFRADRLGLVFIIRELVRANHDLAVGILASKLDEELSPIRKDRGVCHRLHRLRIHYQ